MDGGNGTVSASLSLQQEFRRRGLECSVIDFMRAANPLGALLGDVYNGLLRGDLRLATWYMAFAHQVPFDRSMIVNVLARPRIRALLAWERPDVILTTSPWIATPVLETLNGQRPRPWVCPVVVDLGAGISRSWVATEADFTVLPTRQAQEYLAAAGLPSASSAVCGMPLDPGIPDAVPDRVQALDELGLTPPVCTILGGREGGRNVLRIADRLLADRVEAQIVVQCGRNRALAKVAARRSGVHVVGFLPSLLPLYAVSDVVITKPGALTVAELVALRKSFILDAWPAVMPQEQGNVRFVVEGRLGLVAGDHREIPGMVRRLLRRPLAGRVPDIHGTRRIVDLVLRRGAS